MNMCLFYYLFVLIIELKQPPPTKFGKQEYTVADIHSQFCDYVRDLTNKCDFNETEIGKQMCRFKNFLIEFGCCVYISIWY